MSPADKGVQPAPKAPLTDEQLETLYRSQCAAEHIHLLGSVQPHGFIVVVDIETHRIVQVSSGISRHWPGLVDPSDLVQSDVKEWLWSAHRPLMNLLEQLPQDRTVDIELGRFVCQEGAQPRRMLVDDSTCPYECVGHRTGRWAVLEWIPLTRSGDLGHEEVQQLQRLNFAMSELNRSQNSAVFMKDCASVIQSLCAYDRVMVYRFLPDWSGEVIAEHVATGFEVKYLGMRFPASDIPPQARALYERNTLRVLADVDAVADWFIPQRLPDETVLDQSQGLLRAMSSAHLSYLRNMGVKSTLVISLLKKGKLWGMVSCHHHQPMVPPNHMRNLIRSACELVSKVISVRLDDLYRIESTERNSELSSLVERILLDMRSTDSLAKGFQGHAQAILSHFKASDIGYRVGGQEFVASASASEMSRNFLDEVSALASKMARGEVCSWTDLRTVLGDGLTDASDLAGLVIARMETEDFGFLYLTRASLEQVINWAGNPEKCTKTNGVGEIVLEPRRSFELWQQTVLGKCDDWTNEEISGVTRLIGLLTETYNSLRHRELQNELRWRANHDSLTRLLNRDAAEREIQERLYKGTACCAVFIIDLDHFKAINDTMGHGAGDRLLQVVANRLMSVTRDSDTVARLGGDEFLLITSIVGDAMASIEIIAQRIRDALRHPAEIDGRLLGLHLSAGVAYSPDHGTDVSTLLRHADIALYQAKGSGRGCTVIYTPVMELSIHASMNLEQDLRLGIERGELRLLYQPKVDLQSNRVIGAEALVRWNHPSMGILTPDRFISIAERSDLINTLGLWVIKESCRQIAHWRDELGQLWPVAVNVSFRQFRSGNLVDELQSALSEYGLEPSAVEVELTESVVMEDTSQTLSVIRELNAVGIRISLDDFGTGYSSLSYVRVLPLHTLKIDRSFVEHLDDDETSQIVTRGILGLSKGLGIDTIAEGVETVEQRDWLVAHGCNTGQGYLFSRPVSGTVFPSAVQEIENAVIHSTSN